MSTTMTRPETDRRSTFVVFAGLLLAMFIRR